jgi:hypothetical protein|tara:strand:- start:199 stop:843 length:645 start_codon:yes stop_codon:yes gene_type:complete
MKILLILFLTTFGFSAIAGQNDWKKSEHNYNLKYKEYGVNLRQYYRDDYKHAEFKYKKKVAGQKIELALRIAEDTGSSREYRPKLTHKYLKLNPLSSDQGKGPLSISLGHRIEYRSYELASKDDYWRYRSIAKAKFKLDKNLAVWAKAQPRWIFQRDGYSNDFKIDDIKTNIGTDIKLDGLVTFSPYIELLLNGKDDNFSKKSLMFGTALSFKF